MGKRNLTISGIKQVLMMEAMKHGQPELMTNIAATEVSDIWYMANRKSSMAVGRKSSNAAAQKRAAKKRKNIRARCSKRA